jgi:deoxycytidylate deaminase
MIVGIAGMLGAGKGTIAEFLVKERSFKHLSVREFLIEEIQRRRLEVNRDSMVLVANDLRAKFGPGYIAEQLYERAVKIGGDCVIESLRCAGEVDALRKKGSFVLFGVDADIETRYRRIVERGSSTDRVSFERFVADEQRESNLTDPTKGNLRRCVDMADHNFMNDWTVDELHKKVGAVLGKIIGGETKYVRPSWDEYFMKLAALVAERSTCLRHNIGAIIVRDKRLIASGYNGSAKGMPNCIEVGCLKDELGIKTGTGHETCRAVHAEQNAIIQGATHGISVEGTTMYCTHTPCTLCARMIVNAGIVRVVSYHDYSDESARKFLQKAGVVLDKVSKPSGEIRFVD